MLAVAATSIPGLPLARQRWPFCWAIWLRPVLSRKFGGTQSDDDDQSPLFEKMRQGDGNGHPGDNTKQNKAFDKIVKDRNLNPDQARRVHDAISGKGYSIEEIEQIADDMKSGG